MELAMVVFAGAGWYGWCYWRRCSRDRQREADRAYWDQVRNECPTCGTNRRARSEQTGA
jgi:hypothetical protein